MTMRQSDNGRWYGTMPCILTRVKGNELESLIGSRSPFGGITVNDAMDLVPQYDSNSAWKGREAPASWWEAQGFIVTMPEMFWEIRKQNRSSR